MTTSVPRNECVKTIKKYILAHKKNIIKKLFIKSRNYLNFYRDLMFHFGTLQFSHEINPNFCICIFRKEWDNVDRDLVIVHTMPSTKYCPDASPFTMKLLTYLRMVDIKYQVC